ncbi:MAG TPA: hypothetical protein DDY39_12990 [Nitrospira sp.]|nr:hypothetical protein [Nitrospira sp.]
MTVSNPFIGTCCCDPITTKQLTEPHDASTQDGLSIEHKIPTTPLTLMTLDQIVRTMIPKLFLCCDTARSVHPEVAARHGCCGCTRRLWALCEETRRPAEEVLERNGKAKWIAVDNDRLFDQLKSGFQRN